MKKIVPLLIALLLVGIGGYVWGQFSETAFITPEDEGATSTAGISNTAPPLLEEGEIEVCASTYVDRISTRTFLVDNCERPRLYLFGTGEEKELLFEASEGQTISMEQGTDSYGYNSNGIYIGTPYKALSPKENFVTFSVRGMGRIILDRNTKAFAVVPELFVGFLAWSEDEAYFVTYREVKMGHSLALVPTENLSEAYSLSTVIFETPYGPDAGYWERIDEESIRFDGSVVRFTTDRTADSDGSLMKKVAYTYDIPSKTLSEK